MNSLKKKQNWPTSNPSDSGFDAVAVINFIPFSLHMYVSNS